MPKTVDLTISDKVTIAMLRDQKPAAKIASEFGIGLAKVYEIWREAKLINKEEAKFDIDEYNRRMLKIKKSKKPLLKPEVKLEIKNEESYEPVIIIDSDEEERIKKKRFKRSIDKINRSIERKMKKIDEKILAEANKVKT